MGRRRWRPGTLVLLGVILAASRWTRSGQAPEKPVHHSIMAANCYVRETADREWHLRFVGEIVSQCGVYIVVHDVEGTSLYHGPIPHGEYRPDKPHVVTIEKDGKTGDYGIIMLGTQKDKLGVEAPWTDLPYEVYTGGSLTIGRSGRVYFRAPEGVTKMHLGAFKGHLKVLDRQEGTVVDTRKTGKKHGKYDNAVEFAVTPGKIYALETGNYFQSYLPNTLYLTFDPDRWFQPSPEIQKVKWWETVK